eukprot:Partr_v1_DN28359_c1_g1_i3_m78368 putative protein associated with topoisomerase II homolog 1 (yeast)
MSSDSPASTSKQTSKVMTLAELEASMHSTTIEHGDLIESEVEEVDEDWSEYDALMNDYEKELIAKIQLAQLANDPHYLEDYYFKRFRNKSKNSKKVDIGAMLTGVASSKDDGKDGESQQERFERLLTEVRIASRPKSENVEIAGALGKIAVTNLRNPKKLLDIKRQPSQTAVDVVSSLQQQQPVGNSYSTTLFPFKLVLSCIERVIVEIMAIENLYASYEQDKSTRAQTDPEQQLEWNRRYTIALRNIWADLHNLARKSGGVTPSTTLIDSPPSDKSLALFFSVSKGKKTLPRIIQFLPKAQILLLLKSTLHSLKSIIITSAEPVSVLAELDEYSNLIVFPFVPVISESPLEFVAECIGELLAAGEIIPIARTKPGLLFLTLFVSRGEILRQQKSNSSQEAQDPTLHRWTTSIFPTLFAAFQGRFVALFPPSHIMPSILSSSANGLPQQPIAVDDQYVWQYLAAMAIGASLDQQRILVSELRDKIFEVVQTGGADGTRRVNLFLNALGLDASQLVG